MSEILIRCSKKTKVILENKKLVTGKSIPELLEFAVMNLRFIPNEKIVKRKKR